MISPATARPRRRWIWVLVALVTAMTFVAAFTLRIVPKGPPHHEFGPLASYHRAITGLDVESAGSGAITIRAGRPGQVTVTRVLSWALSKPTVTQSWDDGVLNVGATCPKFDPFENCQADITISVPAGTPVQAQANVGSVTVTGLTGPLHLSATSGLLVAHNVSGPVWATVTSGSLIGRGGLTSRSVYASAASGQITLDFATAPRIVSVGVGSGSAAITVPRGSRYRIVSSRGSGALTVAPGLSNARSAWVVTATIGSGAARIGYARSPEAVQLSSWLG